MSNIDNVNIGDRITFNLYPSTVIGQSLTDVKVLAFLDAGTASAFEDVASLHAQIYPQLPSSTPDNAFQYQYMRLQNITGETMIIGVPWVVDSSITISGTSKIHFEVDNVSPDDLVEIVRILATRGYAAVKTQVV